MLKYILPIGIVFSIVSCDTSKQAVKETTDNKEQLNKSGISSVDFDYIDERVRPQDDFFQFSNNKWLEANPVPASESRWGSFNELEIANNEKLMIILEEAVNAGATSGSDTQILGDYYASFIDIQTRNSVGIKPIQKYLDEIDAIKDKDEIVKIIAQHHQLGINSLFRFGVGQDMKNVEYNIVQMSQGGIGLPNKTYYFDESKTEIFNAYKQYIATIFRLAGYNNEDGVYNNIADFEQKLAHFMMSPTELRVPEKSYNLYKRKVISDNFKNFDFEEYYSSVGLIKFDKLIIGQPSFVKSLDKLILKLDLNNWKYYLKWKVLNHYAPQLSQDFVDANFNFYGKVLTGKSEMKPINEQAISKITSSAIAEVLGKEFVDSHFSETAKNRVDDMVDNLLLVFRQRIKNLEWMTEATKVEAENKLNAISRKLGFPEKSKDFSSLNISAKNYVNNNNELARFSLAENFKKLDKKVDTEEWAMPAHMINAYYHPLLNEIVFPAGIMQPPFFSEKYEDAVNYGRIGMVIGHEFTHGFDDMGSKFGADGSFKNWWTDEDRSSFEERTNKLGKTFGNFCPVEGHCVNPELTMGENIADLGGLTMAYYAYAKTEEFKSDKKINGYSPAQRFFIAYAQLWKVNYTKEELKNRIANDPHSPGMYRVNGPLMNCPEFFEAFNVKEGDKMRNTETKVAKIW